MTNEFADIFISVSLDGGDEIELDELTRELRGEIEDLSVDSVEYVSKDDAPEGTKALEWMVAGELIVKLGPAVIVPLFGVLKAWVERKPSTPVKIKIKAGKKTAEVEYDPTKTSAEELEGLVKELGKTIKK